MARERRREVIYKTKFDHSFDDLSPIDQKRIKVAIDMLVDNPSQGEGNMYS